MKIINKFFLVIALNCFVTTHHLYELHSITPEPTSLTSKIVLKDSTIFILPDSIYKKTNVNFIIELELLLDSNNKVILINESEIYVIVINDTLDNNLTFKQEIVNNFLNYFYTTKTIDNLLISKEYVEQKTGKKIVTLIYNTLYIREHYNNKKYKLKLNR